MLHGTRSLFGKYEEIIAVKMNHCSFYCKQSLSISHLRTIYLSRTSPEHEVVHDPEEKGPDWQELCEKGPGHRYKMCHARYAGNIGQSTTHDAVGVTSMSRVT